MFFSAKFLNFLKSISRDVTVDQANMLLFPIEISRIISILIHGTDHDKSKDGPLKQVNISNETWP